MKRLIFVILFIIFIPVTTLLLWYLKPARELSILVMDKTVLNDEVQEHMSLFWVINNEKFTKPGKLRYNPVEDYYGMFPDGFGGFSVRDFEEFSEHEIDSLSEVYSATFFTDLYGVYSNDWLEEYSEYLEEGDLADLSPIRRIYGGFTEKEMLFLTMMKEKQRLIIAEFNILPAAESDNVRSQFENEFGVFWTGWTGRYFELLDTLVNRELPGWIVENYKYHNDGAWPYKKSGIVLARGSQVVILEDSTHLFYDVPVIRTDNENSKKYGVTKDIKYPFWFEIVMSEAPNNIVSDFHILTNAAGDSILESKGIPRVFPATVHHSDGHSFYYLAGDFSDNPILLRTSYFRYIHLVSSLFYPDDPIERESFFWKYYRPLLKTILNNHYSTTTGK